MNRVIYYFPIAVLMLAGCGKKISHNSGMFWNDSNTSNIDYNADVFSGSNNAIQYNASAVQAQNNSQEPAVNYQTNSSQYNVSQNDSQITQAVNGNYHAQQSNLAKQEGQIDLMQTGYYNAKPNTNSNTYNSQQYSCGKCSNNIVEYDNNQKPDKGRTMSIEVKNNSVPSVDDLPKSYKIQAGYYISEQSANAVASKLRNAGISDVSVVTENGGSKVYVGSFQDRSACDTLLEQVRKIRDDAFVVFK